MYIHTTKGVKIPSEILLRLRLAQLTWKEVKIVDPAHGSPGKSGALSGTDQHGVAWQQRAADVEHPQGTHKATVNTGIQNGESRQEMTVF